MKSTAYVAKNPDTNGYIHYTDEENRVWQDLIKRQKKVIEHRACREYIDGLAKLDLPEDHVPQCDEISRRLSDFTGWSVEPVPALINFTWFFDLLSNKRFPAASFIRTREDFEYVKEPDIFHEIFGHAPLLTDPRFAEFTHAYGKAGAAAAKEDHAMLARLYWFTVEFGLINTPDGLRSYGAGINSSIAETSYALESNQPTRKPFEPLEALRTPYRVVIFQSVYYVIDSFDTLFDLAGTDLLELIDQARMAGMHEPAYPLENLPGHAC